MMLVPRKSNFDLFDDFFGDSMFLDNRVMKTDIKEHDDGYELVVDLPGFDKGDIKISILDGYLEIHAKTSKNNDDSKRGKYIRRERYEGDFRRSFYVGDDVTEDEIKASFKNGILSISIPKKLTTSEEKAKKYIDID